MEDMSIDKIILKIHQDCLDKMTSLKASHVVDNNFRAKLCLRRAIAQRHFSNCIAL